MLVLLAAPFVAHLPNDVAYGVEIVRTGLAPPWEPLALAALVVAAVALLVASTRTGRKASGFDIWPPLLGMIVLQAVMFVVYLLADPLVDNMPPTISTPGPARRAGRPHLAVRGVARARGTPARSLPKPSSAAARLLSLVLGVGGAMSGFWLILCVAAGLSVASGKAQVDGGLSGPTPTA